MSVANSFSHLYSKFAFFLKRLDFNYLRACKVNYLFKKMNTGTTTAGAMGAVNDANHAGRFGTKTYPENP